MALKVIDLLMHFGLSDLPGFLLEEAVQAQSRRWVVGGELFFRNDLQG
jgi:hypothetical protein